MTRSHPIGIRYIIAVCASLMILFSLPAFVLAQAGATKEIEVECDCLAEHTWEAVKRVVSERYPVAILDKSEGLVETEWYSHGGGGVYEFRFVIEVTDELIVITSQGRYITDERPTPARDTTGLSELARAIDERVN